jgi:hypothetical protein
VYIVALEKRRKLCHRVGIGTMRIVTPYFVVSFPAKDVRGVLHYRKA